MDGVDADGCSGRHENVDVGSGGRNAMSSSRMLGGVIDRISGDLVVKTLYGVNSGLSGGKSYISMSPTIL